MGQSVPPDMRALHARAAHRFAAHVARIAPDQWQTSTPCSDWTVRALVDHVVRWNTLMPDFLAGLSVQQMAAPFERDVLGDDPAAAATRSADAAATAFATPAAMEAVVHHPFGELPASYVLYMRLFDNTIHDWDLIQALGIQEPIDSEILSVLYPAALRERDQIRASGHFGPAEMPVAADADVEAKLLAILGRRATG